MKSRFDYVKYDDKAVALQKELKAKFEELDALVGKLQPSRAAALVFEKLEEAYMWSGKAIRDEQVRRGGAELLEERSNS